MTKVEATAAAAPAAPDESNAGGGYLKIALAVGVLIGLVLMGRQASGLLLSFAEWINGLGIWGPIAFIVGYAVATVAFLPGSLLTLAGGAIFGLTGTIYVFLGATLGACSAFLISRYVARSSIEKRLESNEKFATIDRAVADQGMKIVFLVRLSPIFPFNLLNYGLGLTKVRFIDYAIASLGMLPGSFLYVYYGKAVGDIAALASGAPVEQGAEKWIFLGVGLLATVLVTAVVTRIARKALKEATNE